MVEIHSPQPSSSSHAKALSVKSEEGQESCINSFSLSSVKKANKDCLREAGIWELDCRRIPTISVV